MKKCIWPRKLTLAKETLRRLDEDSVKNVRGGYNTERLCPTINSYTCDFSCNNSFNVCCA
jgi:hypothetical protein